MNLTLVVALTGPAEDQASQYANMEVWVAHESRALTEEVLTTDDF